MEKAAEPLQPRQEPVVVTVSLITCHTHLPVRELGYVVPELLFLSIVLTSGARSPCPDGGRQSPAVSLSACDKAWL